MRRAAETSGGAPRSPHRRGIETWLLIPVVVLGILGGVVGLVIGLMTHWQTAWFAIFELGVPAAAIGGLLGAVAFCGFTVVSRFRGHQ